MRDIENPMIEQIKKFGYPSRDYLEWEAEEELERGDVDAEKDK